MIRALLDRPALVMGMLTAVAGWTACLWPQLLAGYNTMTAEQRSRIDLQGLRRAMGWGMTAVGGAVCAAGLMLSEPEQTVAGVIALPVGLALLIARVQRYDYNLTVADLRIRPERSGETHRLHDFIRKAFPASAATGTTGGGEARRAELLRRSGGYLPPLTLVAEHHRRIVGFAMFCAHRLDDGTPVLRLDLLCVRTEARRQGVGTALVREGLRRATAAGHRIATVAGDPAYYGRFGFRPAAAYGILTGSDIPDRPVLIVELPSDASGAGPAKTPSRKLRDA